MNPASRLPARTRHGAAAPLRRALRVLGWLVGAAFLASSVPAQPVAPSDPAAGAGCRALVKVYRGLQDATAVPATERQRVADRILDACGVVEIELVRASTLDGGAVLELPLGIAPGAGGRP